MEPIHQDSFAATDQYSAVACVKYVLCVHIEWVSCVHIDGVSCVHIDGVPCVHIDGVGLGITMVLPLEAAMRVTDAACDAGGGGAYRGSAHSVYCWCWWRR